MPHMDLDEDVFATGDSTQRIAAERLARLKAQREAQEPTTGQRVGGGLQGALSGAATGAKMGGLPGAIGGGLVGALGGALGASPNAVDAMGSNASKVQDALSKTPQDLSSPAPKKTVALGSWDFDDDEMAA